jgi:hypothetical protein
MRPAPHYERNSWHIDCPCDRMIPYRKACVGYSLRRVTRLAVAITVFAPLCAFAQARAPRSLDPRVISVVDRLYPGFVEVIESSDSTALSGLATTLAQNPGAESLEVLLWMLEFSPAWVENLASLKITRTLAAVGTLPLDHIVEALAHGSARERGMAMFVLQSGRTLVSAADATKVEALLVSALSSPDENIRVSAAITLHAMNSATGNAALERALKGPGVSDLFFWHATRKQPAKVPVVVDASTFPTTTVAAVNSIYPGFLKDAGEAGRCGGQASAGGAR